MESNNIINNFFFEENIEIEEEMESLEIYLLDNFNKI